MSKVFLSYRRTDSSDVTGRIYDSLVSRLGKNNVFMDVDAIAYGSDFLVVIQEMVESCDFFLTIIGNTWLDSKDEYGERKLDKPDDPVRIEITTALKYKVQIIPVLVQGASMPGERNLPTEIRGLSRKHAAPIRPDPDFHNDIQKLIRELTKAPGFLENDDQVFPENRVFQGQPTNQKAVEITKRAIRCLQQGGAKEAMVLLKKAHKLDPLSDEANLYLGIALLSQKTIGSLHKSIIREAENHLLLARQNSHYSSAAVQALAAIRFCYYRYNCKEQPEPTYEQLKSEKYNLREPSTDQMTVLEKLKVDDLFVILW